jgi:citrate lyase beta subunit
LPEVMRITDLEPGAAGNNLREAVHLARRALTSRPIIGRWRGVYVNVLGSEGAARVRAAYRDAKYERLAD